MKYFYHLYRKAKLTFPKGFFFGLKTRKQKVEVSRVLYTEIILTYLDLYFKDFYETREPCYFPLSGKLMKSKSRSLFRKKSSSAVTEGINWIWFERPGLNYYTNLCLIKLKGGTGRVNALETEYRLNNDVSFLKATTPILQELDLNHKLYL